jgi:DNA-binding winged helix-turn-helix (wHTH) protein/Tfp pilus assembly protein PilF
MQAATTYVLDRFVVDLLRRELRTLQDEPIVLPARAFDVLALLIERPGVDFSRQELMSALWPGGVVEDNNLDQAVSALRKALGDSRQRPRYVLTLAGRGYRFIGDVGTSLPAAAQAAVPTPPPSHAPPRSRRPGQPGLALGIAFVCAGVVAAAMWLAANHERPATQETAASGLRPASEDAYRRYTAGLYHWQRREPGSHAAAAREFEAAITIDPNFGPAWASLSGTLVAMAVFGVEPSSEMMPRALQAARRAVALDPSSAEAQAALGHALVQGERRYREGEALYAKAIATDPKLSHARMWRAINLAHLGRLPDALEEMREAARLEPRTLAYAANLGLLMYLSRDYDGAVEHLQRLLSVEPRAGQARATLARVLLARGEPALALAALNGAPAAGPGSFADRGRIYAALGRDADAQAELDRLQAMGAAGYGVAYDMATIELALGRADEACASLERALGDGSPGLGMLRIDPALDALRDRPCHEQVQERLHSVER